MPVRLGKGVGGGDPHPSPFLSGQEVHPFLEYTMAGVEQEILGSLRKATGWERRIR